MIKMLKDKEADIADLRLRLSIAEDVLRAPEQPARARGENMQYPRFPQEGLLDFKRGHATVWDPVAEQNRMLEAAFQNHRHESDGQLLRAQRFAEDQQQKIDVLQRQNAHLTEEMRYKDEQVSKQVLLARAGCYIWTSLGQKGCHCEGGQTGQCEGG